MKYIAALLILFVATMVYAQSEEQPASDESLTWSFGGIIMLMAPAGDHEYYQRDKRRYVPQVPLMWLGSLSVSDGVMQGSKPQFNLRDGFLKSMDGGVTVMQGSRNLYRGIAGFSVGLQFVGSDYSFSRHVIARGVKGRIDFEPSETELEDNSLVTYAACIPLLIGVQTPKRWLSLQTGLGLYAGGGEYEYHIKGHKYSEKHHLHTSYVGAQWLAMAGIGPVTITYTQDLTPHFTLIDGTKAYRSSIAVGFDLWYALCRLTRSGR